MVYLRYMVTKIYFRTYNGIFTTFINRVNVTHVKLAV